MDGVESRISPALGREHSRRDFLKTATWATAALAAAGIGGFSAATRFAGAQATVGQPPAFPTYQGLGDVAILSFALQLERLEGTFYANGVDAGLFSGPELAQIATIRDHEMAHAAFITTALQGAGAPVPPPPNLTYPPGTFSDRGAFLKLAATFEPVGIGAFQGAAGALQSKDNLAAAGSILGVECEHRVAINILQGILPPNNLVFQSSLPFPAVVEAVAPFGISP